MIDCAYCDRPLICEACGTAYLPATPEQYQALSQPDSPIGCPECGRVLVCHWCKSAYDGRECGTDDGDGSSTR